MEHASDAQTAVRPAVRFGLVGGFVTVLGAVVYWVAGDLLGVDAAARQSAALMSSRWRSAMSCTAAGSFKAMAAATMPRGRTGRFFVVSLVSLGLNSLFVWILTGTARRARPGGRSSRCCSSPRSSPSRSTGSWVFG